MANRRNELVKRQRNEEFAKRGDCCQNLTCSFTCWNLTFAHLRPTALTGAPRGRGRKERFTDIRKHPDAYALLCWECHRAFDNRGEEIILVNRILDPSHTEGETYGYVDESSCAAVH